MRSRLTEIGVACPAWARAVTAEDVQAFGDRVGWPVIAKTPRGGYDGKGVRVVSSVGEVDDWLAAVGTPGPLADGLLLEERVDFVRELAVLIARSPSNQAAAWPVVETVQTDGICTEVLAPAPELDPRLAARATEAGLRIADRLAVTGVFAVEMFEVRDPETGEPGYLVNELAMRPHNSGHWSMDGAVTGQFEQHLRAVLDLPLGDPAPRAPHTVMANVLGGDYPELYPAYRHIMARDPGLKVHLYGKGVRPGRKIGHVNVSGADLAQLRDRAGHAADYLAGVITE
jgi:5-(carboxyamino)imidazole ribonucleotide synthase